MKMIFALLCLIPGLAIAADEPPVICPQNTYTCLVAHTEDFYLADHDRFYTVYTQAFAKALQCNNYQDVTSYLTIYSSPDDNAEIDESVRQDTEALLLLKPKCFFEGALHLTPEQEELLVGKYQLFTRPNHVMALLHQYMQNGKYKRIASLLYNANLDSYESYGKNDEDAPMDDLYQQYKH